MFCVVKRAKNLKTFVFETYAEMKDYVARVYKPTRIKDGGYYVLKNIEFTHIDSLRAYKERCYILGYNKELSRKTKGTRLANTKTGFLWRLEVREDIESLRKEDTK